MWVCAGLCGLTALLRRVHARGVRAEIRRRDMQRLMAQRMRGLEGGARDQTVDVSPEPLTEPTSPARYLNKAAAKKADAPQ